MQKANLRLERSSLNTLASEGAVAWPGWPGWKNMHPELRRSTLSLQTDAVHTRNHFDHILQSYENYTLSTVECQAS